MSLKASDMDRHVLAAHERIAVRGCHWLLDVGGILGMNILKGMKKVAVGVSGGVDSAVAALLLKNKGYETVGLFMRNWDLNDETGNCTIEQDAEDAASVCHHLGIEFHEVNFIKEYWTEVFDELISDYQNGLTPNPDILCNKCIKFDHFYRHAVQTLGCDAIATGHYARSSFGQELENRSSSGAKLLVSLDQDKDQTFFLSQIPQQALQSTIFPLGDLLKRDVKLIAARNQLEKVAGKKESMGICFIGSRKFQKFISEYIQPARGDFIDVDTGAVVGHHEGKHNYTLGQRCLIGGVKHRYYIALKTESQDIYVAMGHDHPLLHSYLFTTHPIYWIHEEPEELQTTSVLSCRFRFQHREPLTDCHLVKVGNQFQVILKSPLRALTPGQYAVFYRGDECLGSGRINYVGPTLYSLQARKSHLKTALTGQE